MQEAFPQKEEKPKVYFGDRDPEADKVIRRQGWVICSEEFKNGSFLPFHEPNNTEAIEIESNYFPEGAQKNYLVYDPILTDIQIINPRGAQERIRELQREGYEFIDGNITRVIYIKKKK